MNSLLLNASRAFEALKSLLALVGVTALALFLILPLNTPLPEAAVQALVPPAEASAAAGASLPPLAVETPLEREQRRSPNTSPSAIASPMRQRPTSCPLPTAPQSSIASTRFWSSP